MGDADESESDRLLAGVLLGLAHGLEPGGMTAIAVIGFFWIGRINVQH